MIAVAETAMEKTSQEKTLVRECFLSRRVYCGVVYAKVPLVLYIRFKKPPPKYISTYTNFSNTYKVVNGTD